MKEGDIMNKKEFGLVFGITCIGTLASYLTVKKISKNLSNKKRKKALRLKDVLPYVDKPAEIRYVNDRDPLFFIFMKKEAYTNFLINRKKEIIFQDFLPTKLFVVKGSSYNNNFDDLLNKKICHVSLNEDNSNMLDIILVP